MKCWYCSVRDSDEGHSYAFDMHGNVAAEGSGAQTDVTYNVRHVSIPRCADCHARHKLSRLFTLLAGCFALLALIALLLLLLTSIDALLPGVLLGLFAGLAVGALMSGHAVLKGIATVQKSRKTYPEVAQLLKECYRFGSRPKEKMPVSDAPCGSDEPK